MIRQRFLYVGIDYALFIVTRYREGLENGLSVEDAVLSIQRVRSKTEGDFVVIQPARASDGGEAQEGTKAYHSFSVQGESGSGIGVKNTYIRVEVPEDVEEEEDEEE